MNRELFQLGIDEDKHSLALTLELVQILILQ